MQAPGPAFRIVLVDALYPENVGYVARAMANFGVDELVLVRGTDLTDLSRERATHGVDRLEAAKRVDSLDEALAGCALSVATTARVTDDPKKHHREVLYPDALRARLAGVEGTVALVFGREDQGLFNEEIARCDLAVTLPTPGDPSLNLGHAAAVLLYLLRSPDRAQEESFVADEDARPLAGDVERRHLHAAFEALLDAIGYPDHKRFRATTMFRRLMGRAAPSQWEYHRLMGVLTGTLKRLGHPLDALDDVPTGAGDEEE